ncbi:MAG: hypothetical protein PWQ67_1576 [Clostridia bacterium]|jgi:hypothetical protein|nr:hypothetical protein [Clostridia bacterium]MDN5323122.1 hypothetical protein [Clostridia bacterium]
MELFNNHKRAEVKVIFSEFEFPPMQDALLVGKRSPIGPEAARRMVDILSPDQYEIIEVNHDIIEAVVIRKSLSKMIPKEKLVAFLLEEGGNLADRDSIVKAQIKTFIEISRAIEI